MLTIFPDIQSIDSDKTGLAQLLEALSKEAEKYKNSEDEIYIYHSLTYDIFTPSVVVLWKYRFLDDWGYMAYAIAICDAEEINGEKIRNIKFFKNHLNTIKSNIIFTYFPEKINDSDFFGFMKVGIYYGKCSKRQLIAGNQDLFPKSRKRAEGLYYVWGVEETRNIFYDIKSDIESDKHHDLKPDSEKKAKKTSRITAEYFERLKKIFNIQKACQNVVFHDLNYLDDRQRELSRCRINDKKTKTGIVRTKIKGPAGSGKTLVLAQKAVNCYKETKKPILILAFNKSLLRYIKDLIRQCVQFSDDFLFEQNFVVNNFHKVISDAAKCIRIPESDVEELKEKTEIATLDEKTQKDEKIERETNQSIRLLLKYSSQVPTHNLYSFILVDEGQDFKSEYFEVLDTFFLLKNRPGEMVVMADEKQNIYNRLMGDDELVEEESGEGKSINLKMPKIPGFPGRWTSLTKIYRQREELYNLSVEFQKTYMSEKYHLDSAIGSYSAGVPGGVMLYYQMDKTENNYKGAYSKIKEIFTSLISMGESSKEIGIIFHKQTDVRYFSDYLRYNCGIESMIPYISNSKGKQLSQFEEYREQDRAAREFDRTSEHVKVSSIYSFKGHELDTIIFCLDHISRSTNDEKIISAESIYTAMTRAKIRLIVLDFGTTKYGEFFREHAFNTDHHHLLKEDAIRLTLEMNDSYTHLSEKQFLYNWLVENRTDQVELKKELDSCFKDQGKNPKNNSPLHKKIKDAFHGGVSEMYSLAEELEKGKTYNNKEMAYLLYKRCVENGAENAIEAMERCKMELTL